MGSFARIESQGYALGWISAAPLGPLNRWHAATTGGYNHLTHTPHHRGHRMHWLVYHIASGQAFFTGVLLVGLAVAASLSTRRLVRRLTVLCLLIGLIAVVLSSTALPSWLYAIAGVATLAWIVSGFKRLQDWRRPAAYATLAAWLLATVVETPYHLTPSPRPAPNRSMAVIGDSVTAGMGGDDRSETWPTLLAAAHDLQVQDLSHVGETTASALKRARAHEITAPLVVVEIGGNDILGTTDAADFAASLDALLTHLTAPGRQIVMFELPLIPLSHAYGRAQRTLAAKHGVLLIPKRVFLSIIAGSDATLDSIHLTQEGHEQMARVVWGLVEPAYREVVAEEE